MNFLQTLLNFSERAAKLARSIRQDPRLFSLLVEEKGELEKNKRFSQDFKTLADVLIQESLKYYVALKVNFYFFLKWLLLFEDWFS